MLSYIMLAIAVALVIAESKAAKVTKKMHSEKQHSEKWHMFYRWRWVIGIPFVIISAFITYPMPAIVTEQAYKIVGFPIIVAVFDESGRDYVGPLSFVFFLGNAMIWYFLPQLILLIWAKYFSKSSEYA